MIDLSGKTALVTGGSRGIGKSICLTLAKAGANVCFIDIISDGAEDVVNEIKALGVDSRFYQGNITDMDRCAEITDQVVTEFGAVDILV
ncbi:MAG: SDR family NAD(P)-dependent oxidoreductase, partial [Deltaproteobacteria bacterium]|nr:SDR family NAD(P)-dependent oxidoreductase [Deltaproteobacteria bacterium]